MSRNFKAFASSIAAHFQTMSQHELFQVGVSGDQLWDLYLASFPSGTNPIYRTNTEHDGNYDRAFIKRLGGVIALIGGERVSLWDAPGLAYPYDVVSAALSQAVKAAPIVSVFRTSESTLGYPSTTQRLPDGATIQWNHFHAAIAPRHRTSMVDKVVGDINTTVQVFKRGLTEIKPAAIQEILQLIDDKALYRGDEHRAAVAAFQVAQVAFTSANPLAQADIPWLYYDKPAARFRNTVIGTLAVDLSEGVPTDRAVSSFETKVAPANYKRPTALITQGMIKQAMTTIQELGLEPSLDRRHARISDLTINNVLWASNDAKSKMKGRLESLLSDAVILPAPSTKETPISITDFMANVLPKATGLSLLLKNTHQKNLMSLTAPLHSDSPPLFKWPNGFAWSYNGDITDAIRERVKSAGGNVHAPLRVSLAWFNQDDLDLHAMLPDRYGNPRGAHIHFGNKQGILDVDMNAFGPRSRTPVENLAFQVPRDGEYTIVVHQYYRRETIDIGFTLEVECNGSIQQYSYPLAVSGNIECFKFTMQRGQMQDFKIMNKDLKGDGLPQPVWGVQTERFLPVTTVLSSPNHWDGQAIGNLHTFFILDGCTNPLPTRGIYNEFLRSDLEQHRKVFEILGSKTKCEPATDQLSGLGFSSTVRESVTARVTGPRLNQLYKIEF